MKCPACGHHFQYLPKLTGEGKFKIAELLRHLEAFAANDGVLISARQLADLVRECAQSLCLMPYDMGTPRLHIRNAGVIKHQLNGLGSPVRLRYEIDLEQLAKMKETVRA